MPIGIGCLVNVSLSLAGAARFGVWAVAGGTVVGNVVACALTWPLARRLLGWTWRDVGRAYLPVIAACVSSLGAGWVLRRSFESTATAPGAFVACVVTTALGCAAAAGVMFSVHGRRRSQAPAATHVAPGSGEGSGACFNARSSR
jgi:peptidoglycan biosynthesis protein MviN/MurJ (putative lipid II flippase)